VRSCGTPVERARSAVERRRSLYTGCRQRCSSRWFLLQTMQRVYPSRHQQSAMGL